MNKNRVFLQLSLAVAISSGLIVGVRASTNNNKTLAIVKPSLLFNQIQIAQDTSGEPLEGEDVTQSDSNTPEAADNFTSEKFEQRINQLEIKILETENRHYRLILVITVINLILLILTLVSFEVLNKKIRKDNSGRFKGEKYQQEEENYQDDWTDNKISEESRPVITDCRITNRRRYSSVPATDISDRDRNNHHYQEDEYQTEEQDEEKDFSDYKSTTSSTSTLDDTKNKELVKMYSDDYQSLIKQGIKVSVPENFIEGRRVGKKLLIKFKKDRQGEYFVVEDNSNYYLFPKNSLKVNSYAYETIAKLFVCEAYEASSYKKFRLTKAARVTCLSQGEEWQLREEGALIFI